MKVILFTKTTNTFSRSAYGVFEMKAVKQSFFSFVDNAWMREFTIYDERVNGCYLFLLKLVRNKEFDHIYTADQRPINIVNLSWQWEFK